MCKLYNFFVHIIQCLKCLKMFTTKNAILRRANLL
nr:MAG TPA: C2H2 type zinc-finger protein [Caudoviricetes sp.]